MSNLPNPELWANFVEAVKAGRIAGWECSEEFVSDKFRPTIKLSDGRIFPYAYKVVDTWYEYVRGHSYDALCAELRRWIFARTLEVQLNSNALHVFSGCGTTGFYIEWDSHQSEIDCHLSAALWVLEREGDAS